MGQAKKRGTREDRVKQAQSDLGDYDILLRMYRRYDDPEPLCGTLRTRPSGAEVKRAIDQGSRFAKHELSQTLAESFAKHDLNGEDLLKDPEMANLSAILIAYLSRFAGWPLFRNGGNLLVDYNHESIKGPRHFNFTLRGNQGSSDDYDLFESDRVCFWPTLEQMKKRDYAPLFDMIKR